LAGRTESLLPESRKGVEIMKPPPGSSRALPEKMLAI